MSTPNQDPPPPSRWHRLRPGSATIAGLLVGVLLYLVVFVGLGDATLVLGVVAVLIMVALLARSVIAARDARQRAIEREREWFRQ